MTDEGERTGQAANFDFIAAKHFTHAHRQAIDLIVIHTMEAPEKPGKARQVARWFASDVSPLASAHYCVDDSEIIQCVLDSDIAWHAPGANSNGIGIEHAAYARFTKADWSMVGCQEMLRRSAVLVTDLCRAYKIPMIRLSAEDIKQKKRGICGHSDVTEALNGGKGHWDPGPNFPWDQYISMVTANSTAVIA